MTYAQQNKSLAQLAAQFNQQQMPT
jgi:hypothetical protein